MAHLVVQSGVVSSGNVVGQADAITVEAGGTLISATILGSDTVLGLDESSTILLGGEQILSGGGTANNTVFAFSGAGYVESGGVASGVTITSGGSELIYSSGVASGVTISAGGSAYIFSRGEMTSATILAGGLAEAAAGAGVHAFTVQSGGLLILSDAQSASGKVAEGGLAIAAESGSTSISGSVISSGVAVVSASVAGGWAETTSGSSLTGLTLSSGDEQAFVLRGGLVVSGALSSGGSLTVFDGGTTQNLMLSTDSVQAISSGGTSLATYVGFAGTEIVSQHGYASQTYAMSGGSLVVESGGTAVESMISGAVLVVQGAESDGTITGHSYEFISSGGAAKSDTISDNAQQIVLSGGATRGTILSSGGIELVSSGALASATTVSAGGTLLVSSSGEAKDVSADGGLVALPDQGLISGLILDSGAWAVASSGATIDGLMVASDGVAIALGGASLSGKVDQGGTVIAVDDATTAISGSGTILSSGVVVISAVPASAGIAVVGSSALLGAQEQGFVLQGGVFSGSATSGAQLRVYSGGTTSGTAVTDAVETVSSGGFALAGTVTDDGVVYVYSGAIASALSIGNLGFVIADGGGSASQITVQSGGNLVVDGDITGTMPTVPGYVSGVTVLAGGNLDVDFGGVAAGVTVAAGGDAYVFGTLTGADLESGSYAIVESSTPSVDTLTSRGGLLSGSVIDGTVLVEGGTTMIAGEITGDTIGQGGIVLLESGAILGSGNIVNSGGTLILLSGAIQSASLTLNSGTVIASSAVIVVGADTISADSGNAADGLVISSGTDAFVLSEGVISGAVIENYGTLEVEAGGTAQNSVIAAGGTLIVDAGAALAGDLTFSGIEGAIDFATLPTGTVTVSDFGQSDHLFFDTISGGSASYSLISGHTLVVSGIVSGGAVEQTATIVLNSSSTYTSNFVLSSTKQGALEVSYSSASGGSASLSADSSTTYDIPLYVLSFGNQYKIGIELSLDDGATYKMYEFDTGGTGLYAVYNPTWWSSYTAVSNNPSVFYYTSGNTYTAQTVSTTVTFQTSSGSAVGVSSNVGLISSADDPGSKGFTPTSWNSDTTGLVTSAPLQKNFYGDFGVGLSSAESGIDNILSQFPSGASNGFAVTVGNEPTDGAGGIGSLEVGLTAADIAGYTTIIAMQGANGLETFSNSGETSYQELLAEGMLIISSYLSGTLEVPTDYVFDTGAPSTEIHSGSVINSSVISSINNSDGLVLSAASVTVDGTITSGWVLENTGDYSVGSSNAIGDATGYVNTGLNAFWGVSVMFDLADGVIGFKVIACFAEGTRIRTPEGERTVESLAAGDLVMTFDGTCKPVQWLGYRALDCGSHPDPASVMPIRVAAHAFGPQQPARDLYLSPDHALFLEGALIPVKYLINGDTIVQVSRPHVTYYHVELGAHDVIFAEGLPAETYLETGQRAAFANGGAVIQAHPRFAPADCDAQLLWAALGYAPLIIAGPEIERVRTQLGRRTGELRATA